MSNTCPHFTAPDQCTVVQQLAGHQVLTVLTTAACDHCSTKATPPQSLNEVTVSLACTQCRDDHAKREAILRDHGHLLRKVFPSWSEQAWSVAAAVADWISKGAPIVSAELYKHRLDRCDVCPNRDNHRCRHCGCFIRGKATIPTERCPIGLW